MTREELYIKLETAQELLSDVYHFASDNGLDKFSRLMSMADLMIIDSYEEKLCLSCEGTERLVADLNVAIADTIYNWYKSQDVANKGLAK